METFDAALRRTGCFVEADRGVRCRPGLQDQAFEAAGYRFERGTWHGPIAANDSASVVAQSHTPCNRCVRFVTTVARGHATLATKRTLLLTCLRWCAANLGKHVLTYIDANGFAVVNHEE